MSSHRKDRYVSFIFFISLPSSAILRTEQPFFCNLTSFCSITMVHVISRRFLNLIFSAFHGLSHRVSPVWVFLRHTWPRGWTRSLQGYETQEEWWWEVGDRRGGGKRRRRRRWWGGKEEEEEERGTEERSGIRRERKKGRRVIK